LIATLPIGRGNRRGGNFDPKRTWTFQLKPARGTLSIIAAKIIRELVPHPTPTIRAPRTMALITDKRHGGFFWRPPISPLNPVKRPHPHPRHRDTITPGTARLLFLDPAPR